MTRARAAGEYREVALETIANRIRHHIVDMCARPEGGHIGGSLSVADILTALYFAVLDVDPADPSHPNRDIFILSKGHGAVGLYATLAERGYFPVEELATYGSSAGRLMGHPVRAVPGVEMPTGSLGHGLALGFGFALAARLDRAGHRTFVLLGDGELQEGACWEAALGIAAQGLDRVVAIVDRNGLQLGGKTERISPLEPLADKWRGFGWTVREVDGHDPEALVNTLSGAPWVSGRPSVVIAHTVKGKGLTVAGQINSHYATLNPRMTYRAHKSIDDGAS